MSERQSGADRFDDNRLVSAQGGEQAAFGLVESVDRGEHFYSVASTREEIAGCGDHRGEVGRPVAEKKNWPIGIRRCVTAEDDGVTVQCRCASVEQIGDHWRGAFGAKERLDLVEFREGLYDDWIVTSERKAGSGVPRWDIDHKDIRHGRNWPGIKNPASGKVIDQAHRRVNGDASDFWSTGSHVT